jgi:hypothetical protein
MWIKNQRIFWSNFPSRRRRSVRYENSGCESRAKPKASSSSSAPLAEAVALKAAELSQEAPSRFMNVYQRLQGLQTKELEPLLYILNKVHSDPAVASALNARVNRDDKLISTPMMGSPATQRKQTPGMTKSRSFVSNIMGTTVTLILGFYRSFWLELLVRLPSWAEAIQTSLLQPHLDS